VSFRDDRWPAHIVEKEGAVAEGPIVLWTGQEADAIAMSRDLPAGSVVRITRLDDGRSIIVEVRRREPLPYGLLALSDEAARQLGLEERAELQARVEVLSRPEIASR
jgi:rare lipoprotein A (peptidoglycan hydrolase)